MEAGQRVHAFQNDVMGDLDATALADLIRRKELSADEVKKAAIGRIRQVNPVLNGVAYEDYEAPMAAQAGHVAFAGVPTMIKDNIDVSGLPTALGVPWVQPKPAKHDSVVTQQFRAQGFQIIGKTRLPDFGINPSGEYMEAPPTRNPWHTNYTSGASSSGAAVLVASGALPIAHGNDGGGSIRIPAACCGLVGLKPTRARLVNSETSRILPVNIICEGVLTRSVRDTANFMAAAEQYHCNKAFPEIGLVEGAGKKRLRIGMLIDSITGHVTDADTRATVERTAKLLSDLGHHVEISEPPIDQQFIDDFITYYGMLALVIRTFGRFMIGSDYDVKKLDGLTDGLAGYTRTRLHKLPAVIYRLRKTQTTYGELFKKYDAVLTPVLTDPVLPLGQLSPRLPFDSMIQQLIDWAGFTPANNASGTPAISLPMGYDRHGLPIGIQLAATHGQERTLLELAFELEAAYPWRRIQD